MSLLPTNECITIAHLAEVLPSLPQELGISDRLCLRGVVFRRTQGDWVPFAQVLQFEADGGDDPIIYSAGALSFFCVSVSAAKVGNVSTLTNFLQSWRQLVGDVSPAKEFQESLQIQRCQSQLMSGGLPAWSGHLYEIGSDYGGSHIPQGPFINSKYDFFASTIADATARWLRDNRPGNFAVPMSGIEVHFEDPRAYFTRDSSYKDGQLRIGYVRHVHDGLHAHCTLQLGSSESQDIKGTIESDCVVLNVPNDIRFAEVFLYGDSTDDLYDKITLTSQWWQSHNELPLLGTPSGLPSMPDTNSTPQGEMTADPRKVFVVHGRNIRLRDEIFTFLRALDLQPIEWTEAIALTQSGSPYVGEVLVASFAKAQAVIVLLSPDDEVRLSQDLWTNNESDGEKNVRLQARANVLFEAGMAFGHDSRRTILVEVGNVKPFSDVAGRHAVRLDDTREKRLDLAKRLKTAGCAVSMDDLRWLTAGSFTLGVVKATETSITEQPPSTGASVSDVALSVLQQLAAADHRLTPSDVAGLIGVSRVLAEHHLDVLEDQELVGKAMYVGSESTFSLTKQGRAFLATRNLL